MAPIEHVDKSIGKRTPRLLDALFSLAVLFVPYDAVRYLPSNYRPLALVPLALVAFFCARDLLHVRLNRSIGLLAAFSCYAFVVTFVDYGLAGIMGSYFDCLFTIAIGFFVFFVSFCCFKSFACHRNAREYILWFADLVSKAFVVPICVGLVQVACIYHLLPSTVASAIATVFGSAQVGRVAMTSSEASWAASLMLFAAPLIFITYKNSKKSLPLLELIAISALFVVSVSAQGIVTLGLGLLLFPFLLAYVRGDLLQLMKKAIPIVLIVCVLILLIPILVQIIPVPSYVRDRFASLTTIDSLIHSDGSSFIRICHPILCIMMWASSPLLGHGAGTFAVLYPDCIANAFPWAVDGRFSEVSLYFHGLAEPSPLNLYLRNLSEFGIFGFALYLLFVIACIRGVKSLSVLRRYELNGILLWTGFLIAMPFQFQSYCYVPVLMGLAFVSAFASKERERAHSRQFETSPRPFSNQSERAHLEFHGEKRHG